MSALAIAVMGASAEPISLTRALVEFGFSALLAAIPLRAIAYTLFTPRDGLRGGLVSFVAWTAIQVARGNALDVSVLLGIELCMAYVIVARAHLAWRAREGA